MAIDVRALPLGDFTFGPDDPWPGQAGLVVESFTGSEVIGHIDLLINDGRVREISDGEVVRYEATGEPATSDGEG